LKRVKQCQQAIAEVFIARKKKKNFWGFLGTVFSHPASDFEIQSPVKAQLNNTSKPFLL
jgi:hypothetical protein